jgi:NAD(P)-dependent dehydrogenase (short-subunit alcohol dehydrogenase family)
VTDAYAPRVTVDEAALRGQRVVVTGGGSGIGAAVATAIASAGASVIVADVAEDAAHAVAARLGGQGLRLDVSDREDWQRVRPALGTIDLAVLAAGVIGPREVIGADPSALDRVVAIDLMGVVQGTVALAHHMPAGGRIMAIASAAGLFPMPLAPAYGAAKWGVVGWVQSAAPELAGSGIRLCALCPAWTDTPFLSAADRSLLASIGAGVMPVADVVAQAVRLLVAGEAGEIVHVDAEHGAARVRMAPRFEPLPGETVAGA